MSSGWGYCLTFLLLCLTMWGWSGCAPSAVRTMVRLYLFAWIGSSIVLLIGMIIYDQIFTLRTFVYLSAFVSMFIAGLLVSKIGGQDSVQRSIKIKTVKPHTIMLLITISFVLHRVCWDRYCIQNSSDACGFFVATIRTLGDVRSRERDYSF